MDDWERREEEIEYYFHRLSQDYGDAMAPIFEYVFKVDPDPQPFSSGVEADHFSVEIYNYLQHPVFVRQKGLFIGLMPHGSHFGRGLGRLCRPYATPKKAAEVATRAKEVCAARGLELLTQHELMPRKGYSSNRPDPFEKMSDKELAEIMMGVPKAVLKEQQIMEQQKLDSFNYPWRISKNLLVIGTRDLSDLPAAIKNVIDGYLEIRPTLNQ